MLLAAFSTHKPGNRSKHAYSLAQLNVVALRGFIFHDNYSPPKKQGRSLGNSGYKIQKNMWQEIYSRTRTRTRTFGAEVHKSNIRVERWHNKFKIYICYSPAGRSVMGETVPEVLNTARGRRLRAVLRPSRLQETCCKKDRQAEHHDV